MSFRRVINYHRIIEFSWLSEPPLPRAPHFRRRRGKFQAGLVAIKRKNGIDRLRFALVRPRQIRVIIYLTSPVENMDPTRDFRYPKSHFPGAKDKLNVWTGRA